MNPYKYKKVAIKLGSNVLTRTDGMLDVERMTALVAEIAELHRQGVQVILISSGAVASGRHEIHPEKKIDVVSARQLYSAIGQVKLINRYFDLFRQHEILCGQVLTTKENFAGRTHYLNQRNCMQVMLDHGVIPIVNENDTVSVTELMFTDNDELSGLIATMMNMDLLILLSNVDGIYDGNPSDPSSRVIPTITKGQQFTRFIQPEKSAFGRGGMSTKYRIAQKVADGGISVYIANGKRAQIITDIVRGDAVVATYFKPSDKSISNVKKWIAHSDGFVKGAVYINEGAEEALQGARSSSLLFIGITQLNGPFMKDDIVEIYNASGKKVGWGRARYDYEKALTLIGKPYQRPMIHYDYLYLEE